MTLITFEIDCAIWMGNLLERGLVSGGPFTQHCGRLDHAGDL